MSAFVLVGEVAKNLAFQRASTAPHGEALSFGRVIDHEAAEVAHARYRALWQLRRVREEIALLECEVVQLEFEAGLRQMALFSPVDAALPKCECPVTLALCPMDGTLEAGR